MKIEIKSRQKIEDRASMPFIPSAALISITDHGDSFAELKCKPDWLLQLAFDDVPVAEDFGAEIGHAPFEKERKQIEARYHGMTDLQARQIVDFYREVRGKAGTLICQCEQRQSRSATLAAAFLEYGIEVFANDAYFPNRSIYRKILAMLREE